jgi:predicted transcriptional regulator
MDDANTKLNNNLKVLTDLRSSLQLSLHQAGNTIGVSQEAIVKFERIYTELQLKIKELLSMDITPLDEFKKVKANIQNVLDYLKIQKAKVFSAHNEANTYNKELAVVNKDIEFLENIQGHRGQLLNFKDKDKNEEKETNTKEED